MRSAKIFPILLGAMVSFLGIPVPAGLPTWAQAPMAQKAQQAAQGPMKVDIRPLARVYREGDLVKLEITLRDAQDRAVRATAQTTMVIETTSPSFKKSSVSVFFQAGESVQQFQFTAAENGLFRITARQAENQLREGSYIILVGKRRAKSKLGKAKITNPQTSRWIDGRWVVTAGQPRKIRSFIFRRISAQAPPHTAVAVPAGQPAPTSPRLLFQVVDGGHEFLADGYDAARILVFYMSPDGTPAPRDIRVWLTWSNGALDSQPLLIRQGEAQGEARLHSNWPVDAHIALVGSAPAYPVEGSREYTVRFGPAIYGIDVQGPQKLSLVEDGFVEARFYDKDGKLIQTAAKRTISVTPNSSTVQVRPMQVDIEPGQSSAIISVLPMSLGRTELKVSTPGYATVVYAVEITSLSVILLCMGGGIVGGVCAFKAFKGSLPWRIFLGIIGGAFLAWLYVYLALPKTEARIAHNVVSVLFVSMLGGYLGLQALDFGAKRLGLIGSSSKP